MASPGGNEYNTPMSYDSVDKLQNTLAATIFAHTDDAKKASGRALGTLVEIISFYLLKAWGLETSVSIETHLPEYGFPEITHNVEYSLHPILRESGVHVAPRPSPLTGSKILKALALNGWKIEGGRRPSATLLSSDGLVRNACAIVQWTNSRLVAFLRQVDEAYADIWVVEQHTKPYAMVECKRVGVEEGAGRGPQTIEKAKQGAYVANTVSSLHKVRDRAGNMQGLLYRTEAKVYAKPYAELLSEVVASADRELLRDFVLTVGIVSNHGNWFTSTNHNKELKVLAHAYDWLLFLTDDGLAEFITDLLLSPTKPLAPASKAFKASYLPTKSGNRFTKVKMDFGADRVLQAFFATNLARIESWFNVISPTTSTVQDLHSQLASLRDKDWRRVHTQ